MFRSSAANDIFIPSMLEYGVMVRPCEGFDAPGCARVTIGTQKDNEVFVDALKKSLTLSPSKQDSGKL